MDAVDNLTHGLAGALVAQAGFQQRYGRAALVALVVGAELPDIDAVFDLAGPIAGLQHHRGITHSFIGGFGLAILAAMVFSTVLRYRPYWRMLGLLYLGVLLHIWMDYLTSYGTQILLPFAVGRYTADAVFIIDFFYTGIIVTTLLLLRMVRRQGQERYGRVSLAWVLGGMGLWLSAPSLVQQPLLLLALQSLGGNLMMFAACVALLARLGRRWPMTCSTRLGRYGVGALAAYMALCIASHALAERRFAALLAPQMPRVQRIAALPLPGGGPFSWRGIAETASTYLVGHVSLLAPPFAMPREVSKGPEDEGIVRAIRDYRLVRIFHDFARFPVVEYVRSEAEQIVRYSDLRFRGYGRERSWFDLVVYVDGAGQVRLIEFLNRAFLPHHPDF
jgi:membrane-bound metal-dependent hydrolase YbcI (DUF457 family)